MSDSKTYDVVIVGSGISGLVTALVLAKHNYKVCVLEKNHQIGGALQVFSRDKRIFDTGVHYIGGLDFGESLHSIFSYLEILDKLKLERLDENGFDIIRLPNRKTIPHAMGYDMFQKRLLEMFPDEEDAIQKFCKKIQDTCTYFPLYNLQAEGEETYYTNPEILAESAWEYLQSITKNQELIHALLGSGILYAGNRETTPFYVVALILNSFIKGSYRLKDGGSQLAIALSKKIREYGGEVLRRKKVIAAKVVEKKVEFVTCSDQTKYRAKHYISSLHPKITIDTFGKENFLPAYRNRINGLKNTVSTFVVNLSLKEGMIPYKKCNYYDYFTSEVWNNIAYSEKNWPQVLFSCTPATSENQKYADSLSIMAYMQKEEVEKWVSSHNTIVVKTSRGEEYEAFKQKKERQIITQLSKRIPNLEDAILKVYSSTPLTFRDYLGTPEGELYGIEKKHRIPARTRLNSKTKISNLYLTGQNLVFHGILGATIAALLTSFNFVEKEPLLDSIRKHGK